MKVAVIGTGHVGLVTCVSLAHLGHEVVERLRTAAEHRKVGGHERTADASAAAVPASHSVRLAMGRAHSSHPSRLSHHGRLA
jgi:glycine/D-amino acid oxidase-like deaminating enzyme